MKLPDWITEEWQPRDSAELAARIREHHRSDERPLFPIGGATALDFGYEPERAGVGIHLRGLNRVCEHAARDMTVTVEAGISLRELSDRLRAEGQRLPIDVADPDHATIGGALACNASGTRRYGRGSLRDYLIGMAAVDAEGRTFRAGGRVVKNVAGYDLCKLMIGSLGTLGILSELTFKLNPIPESCGFLLIPFSEFRAVDQSLERMLQSAVRPIGIDLYNDLGLERLPAELRAFMPAGSMILSVYFEGSAAELDWQREQLLRELRDQEVGEARWIDEEDASSLLEALTHWSRGADNRLVFKATVRPSKAIGLIERASRMRLPVLGHVGHGIVHGILKKPLDSATEVGRRLAPLRQMARGGGGSLSLVRCPRDWKTRFPLFGTPEPSWRWMIQVQRALDPVSRLNPGRFPLDETRSGALLSAIPATPPAR